MLVLCVCVMSGSAISRTMCIYVYDYMYAICMRQRGHFTIKAARHFHTLYVCGSVGTFTHYMHAAARALSRQGQEGMRGNRRPRRTNLKC